MKLKLKKEVKIFFIAIIIIFATSIGINKYKEYKYHKTNEYKLTLTGYTVEEAKKLERELSKTTVEELITKKKNKNILRFIDEKYFIEKNLNAYIDYQNQKSDLSITDIVAIVNVGANQEWYENIKETDMSKGTTILVNKFHSINNYAPEDLEKVNIQFAYSGHTIRKEVNEAYNDMANQAKKEGIQLIVSSSYRSYEKQESIYKDFYYSKGQTYADSYAARAGHSEHQTGLALDIFSPDGTTLTTFENTDAYQWLLNNAHNYGFILRYPKDKTYLTGYEYESWHFRYLGRDLATKVYNEGITYDEYYAYYLDK